jgi:hypothetical protein
LKISHIIMCKIILELFWNRFIIIIKVHCMYFNILNVCTECIIFASQGLRSALLIFTLGIVRRIFVIPGRTVFVFLFDGA